MKIPAQRTVALAAVAMCLSAGCQAFSSDFAEFGGERVRSLHDRAAQHDAMLELRLGALLAPAMEAGGIDCWLVLSFGDSDPLVHHLTVAATAIEGRAALLMCRGTGSVRRMAFGRGLEPNEALYELMPTDDDGEMAAALVERLVAAAPRAIGIDVAGWSAATRGLSAADLEWLEAVLPVELAAKLMPSAPLVERFLGHQLDVEVPLFAASARLSLAILTEVLSDQVVVAAGTSVEDLKWAVRDRAMGLGLELAYEPHVVVYRPGNTLEDEARMGLDLLLQPGDLFFLSAGVRYLGYTNRYGRWAYLMRTGERAAPPWVDVTLGRLADGLADLAPQVVAGLRYGERLSPAIPRYLIDRAGRLRDGPVDPFPPRSGFAAWDPLFALDENSGVVLTVAAERTEAGVPMTLMLVESAVIGPGGAEFIVAPQRTPILID